MKFARINYEAVQDDTEPGPPKRFNSRFCDEKKLPSLEMPSERPFALQRWLPLILQSRNLHTSAVQVVRLSRRQGNLLLESSGNTILTGQIDQNTIGAIEGEVYPAFESLVFPPQGLFMRLEFGSPKDATCWLHDGQRPQNMMMSAKDIVLRLASSQRAMSEMRATLLSGSLNVKLTFLPFNGRIRSEREYRVFCQPETGRITAISQYQWHKQWLFSSLPKTEQDAAIEEIWSGIWRTHQMITKNLDTKSEMDSLMLKQGYTFDVFYDEDSGKVQLIELGCFGARSSCGSCLFEWVRDFGLLYGSRAEVEFRATF